MADLNGQAEVNRPAPVSLGPLITALTEAGERVRLLRLRGQARSLLLGSASALTRHERALAMTHGLIALSLEQLRESDERLQRSGLEVRPLPQWELRMGPGQIVPLQLQAGAA